MGFQRLPFPKMMVNLYGPSWSSLLAPDLFCPDLIISSGQGGQHGIFPCHKAVLASHSHLMCGLLNDTWGEATIMLPDFSGDVVEQLFEKNILTESMKQDVEV